MAYEYSIINSDSYDKCLEEANWIISDVSSYYHISEKKIRYQQVINYLNNVYKPFATICLSNSPSPIKSNFSELNRFNLFLNGTLGLDVSCSTIRIEKPIFIQKVSGLTTFVNSNPILMLNSSTNQSPNHVIFTIMHEFVHIYKALNDEKYTKQAALIGNYEYSQKAYPDELQPLEDEANTTASLLYAPSASLKDNILKKNFSELCITYTMSWSAMHNRLFNFFYHECGWEHSVAQNAVFAFRYENIKLMDSFRDQLREGYSLPLY